MIPNLLLGRSGEYRVASELLLRGHEVFLASIDSSIDLILGNGNRIQIKTARKTKVNTSSHKRYVFSFKSWEQQNGHYKAHDLNETDFVILWAMDDNVFFIIPANEVRGKFSIQLSLNGRQWSQYLKFKDNWNLLQEKR